MPSPRDAPQWKGSSPTGSPLGKGSGPGVCWPTRCAVGDAQHRIISSESFPGYSPNGFSTNGSKFQFGAPAGQDPSEQLADMKKHMGMLMSRQAELQTTVQDMWKDLANALTKEMDPGPAPRFVSKRRKNRTGSKGSLAENEVVKDALAVELRSSTHVAETIAQQQQHQLYHDSEIGSRRAQMRDMFEKADEAEAACIQQELHDRQEPTAKAKRYLREYTSSLAKIEVLVDACMGFVIGVNAIFLGISIDNGDGTGVWILLDVAFSILFVSEILLKFFLHGVIAHFTGKGKFVNTFDALLVLADVIQLVMAISGLGQTDSGSDEGGMPSASLFRMIRLFKLTRLVRVLKSEMFRDLSNMIHGILAGAYTLLWSVIIFLTIVYIVSLVFRECLGRRRVDNISEYFENVPRSMYTTFRCSFGDCSTIRGSPIFEHVAESYGITGVIMSIFYVMFIFISSIVLFNVISAMFVESTMLAAEELRSDRRRARMQDKILEYSRVSTFIRRILHHSPDHKEPRRMLEAAEEIATAEVSREVIDLVVKDPQAQQALDDLDISVLDHARLSDIFDPDNGGTVNVMDIAQGIRRLRGEARQSDIVCIDLMIRSMQDSIGSMMEMLKFLCGQTEDT